MRTISRSTAISVVLVTALALLLPMTGNAGAQTAQPTEPYTVDQQPPTDTAVVRTCNPFTTTVTGADQQAVAGQAVTVTISQQTGQTTTVTSGQTTTAIGFCDAPPGSGPNNSRVPPDVTCTESGSGTELTRTCTATYRTDDSGQFTFGVTSNTAGEMTVTSSTRGPSGAVYTDTSTKTWTGSIPAPPGCDDNLDNDGDGLVDFPDDPGCSSATD
ncbi:MAG: hypothetical protein ABR575_04635, partial [Actinomycetota bacterium]